MKLILARHGNTFEPGQPCYQVGRKTDLPLVEAGRQQARALGEHFKGEAFAAVYAGSLERQKETAQIITETMGYNGLQHFDTEALDELDYGKWEGKRAEEVAADWPLEYQAWTESCQWPDGIFGGSFEAILTQIRGWLAHLRTTYAASDQILAVSSGGIIRFFYALLTDEWGVLAHSGQIPSLKVKTGHYCFLDLSVDPFAVLEWNRPPSRNTTFESVRPSTGDYQA